MIRRAILIAAAALALSAAGAMAFTPAFARAGRGILRTTLGFTLEPRSLSGPHATNGALLRQDDAVQGTFCPIRPPAAESTALIPETTGAQMSTDPGADAVIDTSSRAVGELLPPAPAICHENSPTLPMQSSDGR